MSFTRQAAAVNNLNDAIAALSQAYASPTDLTDEDDATVDATWDADAAGVVNNLRTRLGEIEALLVQLGIVEIAADA